MSHNPRQHVWPQAARDRVTSIWITGEKTGSEIAAIIAAWGADDWLGRSAIVARHSEALRARFPRYKGTTDEPRTWGDACNLVHHALRLGLLREETGPGGERGWRILDRQPHWIVVGTGLHREAKQVRGLPAAEQAVVDKPAATARKRAATLDRKARFAADEAIANWIRSILRINPNHLVPQRWGTQAWVPAWVVGTRLDAAAAVVREAHHSAEMDRPTLKSWTRALWDEEPVAGHTVIREQRERAALPEHAEIPAENAAALGDLTL